MKKIILLFFAFVIGYNGYSQFGYEDYVQEGGLKISTKWGSAKNEDGDKQTSLLLRVENTNGYDATYSMEILFYYEGILRERGMIEDLCIAAGKTTMGKLNGLYFIPSEFTDEQLKNKDFNFELNNIQVEEIPVCEE